MNEKLRRFVTSERRFQISVGLIVLLLAVLVFEWQLWQKQIVRLKQIKEEKNLVASVEEMKKKLQKKGAAAKPGVKLVLQGTVLKSDVYHALINGAVYKKGDSVGEYKIAEILKESVTLESKAVKDDIVKLPLSR